MPCLWRTLRNKRSYFDKKKPKGVGFQQDYTSDLKVKETTFKESCLPTEFKDYRFKYPDFLPITDPAFRHSLTEKLEREEMFKRRKKLFIPGMADKRYKISLIEYFLFFQQNSMLVLMLRLRLLIFGQSKK